MSVLLAKMLGKAEAEVAKFVGEMEERFGCPSEDVRLVAQNRQAALQKIADLNLDPHDTVAEELYHALRVKFAKDNEHIDRQLGITPQMSFGQRLAIAEAMVKKENSESIWAVKSAAIKTMLRTRPPKKTLARLNYRSIDSMLKHEDSRKVLLCAEYVESSAWRNSLASVTPMSSDYEQRPVDYLVFTQHVCHDKGPANFVMSSKMAGAVSVWPDKKLEKASGLHLFLLLTKAVNKLGVKIDLKKTAQAYPALSWWSDSSYLVSLHNGRRVSFNLYDVAANHIHKRDHSVATTRHGEKSLWDELAGRYGQFVKEDLQPIESEIVEKAKKLANPTPAQLAEDLVNI